MITIFQALNWLNENSQSEIPEGIALWIDQIIPSTLPKRQKTKLKDLMVTEIERLRQQRLPKKEQARIISFLIGSVENLKDMSPLWAEILVICGAYAFRLNKLVDADSWIKDAKSYYEVYEDHHRLAVVEWMDYIVLRAQGKYTTAFHRARNSRQIFIDLAESYKLKSQGDLEKWYNDQIREMTRDLISSPEDTFEWLREFEATHLGNSAVQIEQRLLEFLEEGNYQKVEESSQLLLGLTQKSLDPLETGEVLAYCGVIHWVRGNRAEAMQFFRSAMTQFVPGSHRHALLRWMLGLALWSSPAERIDAMKIMELCVSDFDGLRQTSVHKNLVKQSEWYLCFQRAMKDFLANKIKQEL